MNGVRQEFLIALGLGSVALVAGMVTSAWWPAAAVAAAIYAGWHLVQAWRYRRRLATASLSREGPPGIWGALWHDGFALQAAEHKSRKKLARFDSRFRDAAVDFPDALVALSRSRNVRWCNRRAAEWLFARPAGEVAGKKLSHLIDSAELHEFVGTGDYSQPLVIKPPSDNARVLRVRMLPFGRKKHQLLLIATDITRLFHLDAARRDFVANVSHELRTPLTVITGYLDPLAEQLGADPEWRHSIRLMAEQATRMQQMIDDLTLLSRLESEEKPLQQSVVNIEELLIDSVRQTRALPYAEGHLINVSADPDIELLADPGEIRSVITNLVTNALRHTPAGTDIEIEWQRSGDGAQLTVSDNGPGIALEHLPRLTERFYRVDPARSRRSGGTGLGLAIVKHVLTRHEAEFAIDSQPGRGSRFSCEFPAHRTTNRGSSRATTAG